MNISKLMTTCALVALTAACTNDDSQNIPSNYPEDNVIRVTAGVSEALTRAESVTPLDNENFSLTVLNTGNAKYSYNNKKFTKDATTGDWTCADLLLWEGASKPVTILAYSPIIDGAQVINDTNDDFSATTLYEVATDQTTPDAKNDLLVYKKNVTPANDLTTDGKLNITLSHVNCLIDINVTLGTEFNKPSILTENPITEVTVGGTFVNSYINFDDIPVDFGIPTESRNYKDIKAFKGDFTPAADAEANAVAKFNCIVLPQTVNANSFKVTLKTADKTYVWTAPNSVSFNSGKRYTLNLEMGDNVVLLKNDITATPWTSGGESDLETE